LFPAQPASTDVAITKAIAETERIDLIKASKIWGMPARLAPENGGNGMISA
jgi:hypothetical protein